MSTRKNIKGQKNVPFIYDEVKEKRTISITPSSWRWLKEQAKINNTSPSEIIERFIRDTKG
ncbi:MAG: hypothetical protein AAF757_23695 [Cyanobacteria bacterium P01_D01_bin.116]